MNFWFCRKRKEKERKKKPTEMQGIYKVVSVCFSQIELYKLLIIMKLKIRSNSKKLKIINI